MKTTIQLIRAREPNKPTRAVLTIELRTKNTCAPHLTIDREPCAVLAELSICADVYYPGDRKNNPSAGGQCIDTIREFWGSNPTVAELCDLWDRWHLNGMRAGTRAQQEHLRKHPPEGPFYPTSYYEKAMLSLEAAGLSPDDGYKYGQAWLAEPIPELVKARLAVLCRTLEAT